MNKLGAVPAGLLASTWYLVAAACGGGEKHADSPTTCPEGTVLKGADCVPESSGGGKSGDDGDAPKASTKHEDKPSLAGASGGGEGPSYDRDAVEAQLRRAAKQVKDNCGSASDDDGNKTGPWGTTSAAIVLGRNGHVAEVTVPSPYGGKPVGDCVVRSFKKIQFPPYSGSTDVSINWDIEIAAPKHK